MKLAAVYAALRPRNLRAAAGPAIVHRGTTGVLLYEMTNTSAAPVLLPVTSAAGQPGRWFGVIEGWLEPLKPSAAVDACLAGLGRKGTWFAMSGTQAAVGFGPASIPAGGAQTASLAIAAQWTACLPTGSYRYHLEYRRIETAGSDGSHDPIAAVALDIELRQPTAWTVRFGYTGGQVDGVLAIPSDLHRGSGRLELMALPAGKPVTVVLRAGACDARGPRLTRTSFTAPSDGSRTFSRVFDISADARRALRSSARVSVWLTVDGSKGCAVFSPSAYVPPADRAPTTWGGGVLREDLGTGVAVSASAATFAGAPAQALDGDVHRTWNAGGYPPAWIEIDLGRNQSVDGVRLLPSQSPSPAETVHRIYGRPNGSTTEILLAEQRGTTTDNAWLEIRFASPALVQYVRVATVSSPSWVAWREIALIGASLPGPSTAPVGYHDGTTFKVASGAQCSANGWAADPDDRTRNVSVRILVDGTAVWTGIADDARHDVAAAGAADGTSGFMVDLQGLLAKGTPHEIRVQAQDLDTGRWSDLGATPRTLTCL